MQTAQPSLFTRDDTFFGVCQGLGEDLGFNPDYLRLALPLLLFLYPVATFAGYAAAGAAVLLSRLLFPEPRSADAETAHASPAAEQPVAALEAPEAEAGRQMEPLAA